MPIRGGDPTASLDKFNTGSVSFGFGAVPAAVFGGWVGGIAGGWFGGWLGGKLVE
jgi:hypothetical protein